MATTLTEASSVEEIERLHACFVEWYRSEGDRSTFDRIAAALAPEFEMVVPDGSIVDREAVLESIESAEGSYRDSSFDITIESPEPILVDDDRAVVRYIEHQEQPDEENRRISTAVLAADSSGPDGIVWLAVHETWIEREG